jgi:quinol-cytochrome oxidoreductase complex cytochrome b subunit
LGGIDVGQPALTRFYMLHIVLLPLLFFLLMGLHFWRIRKNRGLNLPNNVSERVDSKLNAGEPELNDANLLSWPVALWAEIAVIMFTLCVLFIFALALDAPLMEMANAAMPENPAKAPWYFLGVQELVSYSAFGGGILVPLFVIFVLFLIPYLDVKNRTTGVWFSGKNGLNVSILSASIALIINISVQFLLVQFGWVQNLPYWLLIIINPGILLSILFTLISFFIYRFTQSVRMAVIALFSSILSSYTFFTIVGIWFRGPDWQFIFF